MLQYAQQQLMSCEKSYRAYLHNKPLLKEFNYRQGFIKSNKARGKLMNIAVKLVLLHNLLLLLEYKLMSPTW